MIWVVARAVARVVLKNFSADAGADVRGEISPYAAA